MKLVKKMMVAGLTGALMLGNCMAAFASESGAYLYGQELVSLVNRPQEYLAIVVGDSDGVIDRNELTFDEGNYSHTLGGLSIGDVLFDQAGNGYGAPIPELKRTDGIWNANDYEGETSGKRAINFHISNGGSNSSWLYIVKYPDNVNISELSSELKKHVIYAKDMSTNPESWRSDANGWWYDNGDGTYPTNRWLDIAGKSYYFGADGYMIHDTKTPDAYTVGSDGALVNKFTYENNIFKDDTESY